MDRERFDALARLLATKGSRRGALGTFLSVTVLGLDPADGEAKRGKRKARDHDKRRGKDRRQNRDDGKAEGQAAAEDDADLASHASEDAGADLNTEARRSGAQRPGKGGKGKGKKGGKRKRGNNRTQAQANGCCGNKTCSRPTGGSNRSRCNFAGQNLSGGNYAGSNLSYIDGRGTNFNDSDISGGNFGHSCLQGATFVGAELGGVNFGQACLFDVDFTDADLQLDSPNLVGAKFCRTIMPDGSVNNRDCDRGSACCEACNDELECPNGQVCCGGSCRAGECCGTDASACEVRECQTATCSNNRCSYTPVRNGPGPDCDTRCCSGVCCPAGVTTCNANNQCTVVACNANTCPNGCCDAQGVCRTSSDTTCGTGGVACVDCPDGQVCNARGICVCNAQSCPQGCCDTQGRCRPRSDTTCGVNGAACVDCPDGQTCNAQGQCASPVCNATTCPNGCCDATGVCRTNSDNTCGIRGVACVDCPGSQVCTAAGVCCTPESPAETCAGTPPLCGTVLNNCGQPVICDCPVRTCRTPRCDTSGDPDVCRYTPVFGDSGPNCDNSICCRNANGNPVCCPVGTTTCTAAGLCGPVAECDDNGDCDANACEICNLATGTCVVQCSGQTPVCDGSGTCVECVTDAQCDQDACEVCNTDNVCVSECSGETPVCNGNGTCVECIGDGDCDAAACESCNTTTGTCFVDCPDTTPICNGNGTCVECVDGGDCPAGAPICNSSGECVECVGDDDCDEAACEICQTSTGTCVVECTGQTPICNGSGTCVECLVDGDCDEDACESCNTDTGVCFVDCPEGTTCDGSGDCIPDAECDAESCPDGCCDAAGICQTNSQNTCGIGGVACVDCPDTQVCTDEGICCTPEDPAVTCAGTPPLCGTVLNNCGQPITCECPVRTCRTPRCVTTGDPDICRYDPVFDAPGPNCEGSICCQNANGGPRCCPPGTRTCTAAGLCGPVVECNADTCPDGCCDAQGNCRTNSDAFCGVGGAACVACDTDACFACLTVGNILGICASVCTDALPICNPIGVCVAEDECEVDTDCNQAACFGCDGGTCVSTCPDGQTCDGNGTCVPAAECGPDNCPNGCCDPAGICRTLSDDFCGVGGAECVACDTGACFACVEVGPLVGICLSVCTTGLPICNPLGECVASETCADDGDCNADACLVCGPNGNCVSDCGPGEICAGNGNCVPAGTCNAQTCPNGCCDTSGVCHTLSDEFCGVGGAECVACDTGACFACVEAGALLGICLSVCTDALPICNPLGQCVADDSCTSDTDCNALACFECDEGTNTCVSTCDPGETCDGNGGCVPPTVCNANTCPNGCCDSTGTCRTNSNEFCGVGGRACVECNSQACQVCATVGPLLGICVSACSDALPICNPLGQCVGQLLCNDDDDCNEAACFACVGAPPLLGVCASICTGIGEICNGSGLCV